MGTTLDITVERKQLSYKQLKDRSSESSYLIQVRNAKSEAVTIRIQEDITGEWSILAESQSHTKEAADKLSWLLDVPANGTASLRYNLRTKF